MALRLLRHTLRLLLVLTVVGTGIWSPSRLAQADAGEAQQFAYDTNGNVIQKTAADGSVTTYTYDAGNRLTAIHYPDQTVVSFAYDAGGNRVKMVDNLGTTSYTYDIHNRLTGVTDARGATLTYAYDARDLLTQIGDPGAGVSINYTWSPAGQLATVQDAAGTTSYQYDAAGSVVQRVLPNGVKTAYTTMPGTA